MQAKQATRVTHPQLTAIADSDPHFNISFAFKRIADGSMDHSCAQEIAQNFRIAAESLVIVLQDAMESTYEGANKVDRFTVLQTVSDLMEAANTLDKLCMEA